jgi:hypothetical protein
LRSLRSHVHDGKAALAQDADVLPRVRVLGPLKELELVHVEPHAVLDLHFLFLLDLLKLIGHFVLRLLQLLFVLRQLPVGHTKLRLVFLHLLKLVLELVQLAGLLLDGGRAGHDLVLVLAPVVLPLRREVEERREDEHGASADPGDERRGGGGGGGGVGDHDLLLGPGHHLQVPATEASRK